VIQRKTMEDLGRVAAADVMHAPKHSIIVILDDVRSMQNVGSVFRTCDAFAARALYLCGYTPQPPHRDIHKTALGATETVTWKHFSSVEDAIAAAKAEDYKIIAVEQAHNSDTLIDSKYANDKLALIFGNEVTGVSEQVLIAADGCIEIPQWGSKHSLNISVSVGIVLWEMVRMINLPATSQ
jgi:23S rRNA (guanosine2251-2'-O)-methyltransferase